MTPIETVSGAGTFLNIHDSGDLECWTWGGIGLEIQLAVVMLRLSESLGRKHS